MFPLLVWNAFVWKSFIGRVYFFGISLRSSKLLLFGLGIFDGELGWTFATEILLLLAGLLKESKSKSPKALLLIDYFDEALVVKF